jgi:hypothetical protein
MQKDYFNYFNVFNFTLTSLFELFLNVHSKNQSLPALTLPNSTPYQPLVHALTLLGLPTGPGEGVFNGSIQKI